MYSIDDRDSLTLAWAELKAELIETFGKPPDLQTILFLIGIQELGQIKKRFTKEQKQDLIHIAVCHLLSQEGYFELERHDVDGWPHYVPIKPISEEMRGMLQQDEYLKIQVLRYFGKIAPAAKEEVD